MASRWYKILPFIFVIGLAFTMALVKIDDPDVWWHLKCGEIIFNDHWFPSSDIFSYTASGSPWIDGYIPAQVLFYLSYRLAGLAGVGIFGALIVAVLFAMALFMSRSTDARGVRHFGAGYAVALALSAPSLLVARGAMLPRPALFTPLFALITIFILDSHHRHGGRRIYWLVPLTALWANCHPAFLLGLILAAIYLFSNIAGPVFDRLRKFNDAGENEEQRKQRRKELALALALMAVATFINPYGYKIYYSAFALFSNPQMRNVIVEWKPLFGAPPGPAWTISPFIVMVAAWVACAAWAWRRVKLEHILLFIFIASSAIFGRRNVLLFGPLALPIIAWTLDSAANGAFVSSGRARFRLVAVKAVAVILSAFLLVSIWWVATDRFYFHHQEFRSTGTGVQPAMFPVGAAEFLKNEPVQGNVFHIYAVGGYLIFELYPTYRVFIDGRIYPYPYELFETEEKALYSNEIFERIRTRYDIRAVLLTLYPQAPWSMIQAFLQTPSWAVVQADGTGVLFLGRGVGNDDIIKRHEMNLLKDPPALETRPAGRTLHFWNRAEYPYGSIRWAKLFEQMGRADLAANALKPALNFLPLVENIEPWLGDLLVQSGSFDEGLALVQKTLKKDPRNLAALSGLADYHIKKNELDEAEQVLERIVRRQPDTAKAWNSLGEISFNRHDFGAAANRFQKALAYFPNDAGVLEKLGMSLQYFDRDGARAAYGKAIEILKQSKATPEDIKRVEQRMNDMP